MFDQSHGSKHALRMKPFAWAEAYSQGPYPCPFDQAAPPALVSESDQLALRAALQLKGTQLSAWVLALCLQQHRLSLWHDSWMSSRAPEVRGFAISILL